jgi:hypothetical protein
MSEEILDNPFDDGNDSLNVDIIFNKLLTNDDIALKTELHNPLALAQLKTLAEYFKTINFTNCEKTINAFITAYCEYMVSYKRQGRLEIVKGIAGMIGEIGSDKNSINIGPKSKPI